MHSDPQSKYGAVFSDGKTASSHKINVVLGPQGLELFDEQEQLLEVWAYDQISSTEHLHPGEAAQLGHKENPGARLYIERTDFAAQLIEHLPHMSRSSANKRVLIPVITIGLIITGLIGGIWMSGYSISEAIARVIPQKVRDGLGTQVVTSLSRGRPACSKKEGLAAFTKLVDRLDRAAGTTGKFEMQVMPLGMMNAFAAPGERIVVSKKLIDFVETPEELAGVIAHEMGHGIKMHPEAGIVRALGISAAINIAFGGSTGGLGDIGALLLQLKYSRSSESEADKIAVSILQKAEIPPKPFAAFFKRLEDKFGLFNKKKKAGKKGEEKTDKTAARKSGLEKTLSLLSTHPSSPERVAFIEQQPDWKTRPLLSGAEWKALQNICDDG